MNLTTTQTSALVELRRYGRLWPSRTAWESDTQHRAFSHRTLQALVDAGLADWDTLRDGVMPNIVPLRFFEPGSEPATAGNNRKVHYVRVSGPRHQVTVCGVRTPRQPQTTQAQLPKCRRCF